MPTVERDRLEKIAHAATRGTIAAMAMTGLRTVTQSMGWVPKSPPEVVLERGDDRDLAAWFGSHNREVLVQAAHWAYGAAGGAIFGSLPEGVRRRAWAGPVYGVILWLAFEGALAPMLWVPREGRAAERAALLADHVLYGLVLSEIRRRPQA
ncbi:hypothetical protein CLV30_102437 [Haloactinopolyspora alba]|uniref:DUF1440 domain-containing protein n=1 Tax=Haloactinopolyspora alba TaxID=648780 RepID=A0A2P8EC45_9ACTN|nr:hypothetical protein [Haloactinopolyspora alba]PSL07048.1 hypothetical protein CLV30_102437 [Haloactinopolyspora alba]